jgi:diguanylate cyclase (GGDEF)-like protein/PAS domain S-box-containing protein
MLPLPKISHSENERLFKFRSIVSSLAGICLVAIIFTLIIIQVQSAASAYLAALSIWSRSQVETVRHSHIYASTGNTIELEQARYWYQIPYGHLQARAELEAEEFDYEAARKGFLLGGNHPDDIPRLIWLYRFFNDFPYFNKAMSAWRDSDELIVKLGEMINKLEVVWLTSPPSLEKLAVLQEELSNINRQLSALTEKFREKMSLSSRVMANVLSVTSVAILTLLGCIATLLILKLTASIRSSENKFRKTFEHAAIGIVQIDDHGRIIEANNALCDILIRPRENLIDQQFDSLIYSEDSQAEVESQINLLRSKSGNLSIKQRLCQSDGSLIWANLTMSVFDGKQDNKLRFICLVEDVSEQHRLTEELSYHARHDMLTGLINRRTFEDYLEDALVKSRSENLVNGLCFIDLDQFKIINDTLGHYAGDQLLKQVSQLFSKNLRKRDLLARLGGDEFGLILDCCEPEKAVALAESLRKSLNELPFVWEGRSFNLSCSVGIVPITESSSNKTELLQAADSACHLAKERGRNRVVLTSQGDKELAARRGQMEWLERIRHAIDNHKLLLYVQRLVPIPPQLGERIEVLVRMKGDQGEIIPPGAFLPAAERFGIAHLLDRWVIEHVCEHFKSYPEDLDKLDACHINLSGTSFEHSDFTEFTLNTLNKCGIPAHKICFEITETAAISNLTDAHNFMSTLRQAGSTFALDDFGSGLSSFAYLKQLPVEYLKIDGAFVKNMANDSADQAMVKAITDIGQTLGKIMVAEFVEDQQTLDLLKKIGVQYAQGYHLHRPESFVSFREHSVTS